MILWVHFKPECIKSGSATRCKFMFELRPQGDSLGVQLAYFLLIYNWPFSILEVMTVWVLFSPVLPAALLPQTRGSAGPTGLLVDLTASSMPPLGTQRAVAGGG